jgi:hypothetical protein
MSTYGSMLEITLPCHRSRTNEDDAAIIGFLLFVFCSLSTALRVGPISGAIPRTEHNTAVYGTRIRCRLPCAHD